MVPLIRARLLAVFSAIVLLLPNGTGARPNPMRGEPLSAGPPASSGPLAIVVNRSNPLDGVTSAELRRIFLGSRTYWPNGRRITILMREPGDLERDFVLREVCGMTEQQFKTHFLHGLYTGEILVSPKILDTSGGVKKFIFNVPGAVGYVRLEEVDDTVKVLRIDERLPSEKGYRLQIPGQAEN